MILSLLGLHKDAQLISIGLISEDNTEFYAEFTDVDISKQDDWIKKNVLENTIYYGNANVDNLVDRNNYYIGDKNIISKHLRQWLAQFDDVQLVSDVCHYDMVLFIDLFGTAFDLPKNVSASCRDINQDIADYYKIDESVAFDFSREQLLEEHNIFIDGEKHNSLYDAKVIKEIFGILRR